MFDDAAASRAASFSAFESAVARADSSAGDDLGGVVYDWGCVLVAHAQTELERARSVATQWRSRDGASVRSPDAAWSTAQREAFETAVASAFGRAASALDAAEEKLARAAEFSPGDVAPLVAKGEALQTRAETQRRRREFAVFVGAGDGSGFSERSQSDGTGGSEIEALVAPLRLAADAAGGAFGAALRVDATHFDALVGLAECRVEIGKDVRLELRFGFSGCDATRVGRVPSRVAFVSARARSRRRGRRGERRARLRVRSRLGAGPTERRVRRGVRRALSGRERDVRRDSRQRLAMRRMRARDHRRGRGPGGSAAGAVGRRVETRKNHRNLLESRVPVRSYG